jgi:hypothetical protein
MSKPNHEKHEAREKNQMGIGLFVLFVSFVVKRSFFPQRHRTEAEPSSVMLR